MGFLCAIAPDRILAQQTPEQLFGVHCGRCHASIEIEQRVRNDWAGRTAHAFLEEVRRTMPAGAPDSLSDDDYLQLVTYILDISGIPRPAGPLTADSLAAIALQPAADSGDEDDYPWRNIHGELNANRYSPLDQIDASNAQALDIVWRFSTGNFGPEAEIRSVTMPIMHNDRLYLGAGKTRNIVSLDAETGQLMWMWRPDEGDRYVNAPRKSSGMGVAYWEGDDGRRRVITVTPGYYLVSLNADSGQPDPEFGAGGWG